MDPLATDEGASGLFSSRTRSLLWLANGAQCRSKKEQAEDDGRPPGRLDVHLAKFAAAAGNADKGDTPAAARVGNTCTTNGHRLVRSLRVQIQVHRVG